MFFFLHNFICVREITCINSNTYRNWILPSLQLVYSYPFVSKTLRELGQEQRRKHTCTMTLHTEGIGYPDLDDLINNPCDLEFIIGKYNKLNKTLILDIELQTIFFVEIYKYGL